MKTFKTANGTRAAKRAPTADERRERRIYWAGVHVGAVLFFLICVVASGVIT
jgi:hypothetical protein